MHAENSWGYANERVSQEMIFLQRELGRAAMGIASSANYEQCLVPLENGCFDAALLYGIRSRHANASRHCQITMRLLLNLNLLW